MVDYEIKEEENRKRNEKYIKEFKRWLNKKNLAAKTIKKHLNNVDLYINDYLNYYDVIKAEDGMSYIYSFLDGWFIEKCMWSTRNSIKETYISIKKFYQFMSENSYVNIEFYKKTCDFIKENMDEILNHVDKYNNLDEDDFYDEF